LLATQNIYIKVDGPPSFQTLRTGIAVVDYHINDDNIDFNRETSQISNIKVVLLIKIICNLPTYVISLSSSREHRGTILLTLSKFLTKSLLIFFKSLCVLAIKTLYKGYKNIKIQSNLCSITLWRPLWVARNRVRTLGKVS